ncbi:hypothetical protein P5V15_003097 [Pogonomyrmex californicus]
MKLLGLILALSCIIAYTAAKKKGQYWPTDTKIFTIPHRFRREIDSQDSVLKDNLEDTPQLFFKADENLHLLDNKHTIDDISEDTNVVSGSESQLNTQLNDMHLVDENDYLNAYTFTPGAYSHFAQNFGGFRWRREARRHTKPHFRFEAEKKLGKNGFVNGFVDLQQGANGRRIEPMVGGSVGFRFRREADQIEDIEDELIETI